MRPLPDSSICGVYEIRHVPTGDCYIGSGYVRHRITNHLYLLRNARHWSMLMQEAWDKDGLDAFAWSVLWQMPKSWTRADSHSLYRRAEVVFIHERQPAYNAYRHESVEKYVSALQFVASVDQAMDLYAHPPMS